jgi:hypothetical protein
VEGGRGRKRRGRIKEDSREEIELIGKREGEMKEILDDGAKDGENIGGGAAGPNLFKD